ncbi:hypothetical protein HDU96_006630 [Phlyctochytrium bullatum]|nr:hypothetical protein HDU96_006630 [Phlyctochytrium bullatum]
MHLSSILSKLRTFWGNAASNPNARVDVETAASETGDADVEVEPSTGQVLENSDKASSAATTESTTSAAFSAQVDAEDVIKYKSNAVIAPSAAELSHILVKPTDIFIKPDVALVAPAAEPTFFHSVIPAVELVVIETCPPKPDASASTSECQEFQRKCQRSDEYCSPANSPSRASSEAPASIPFAEPSLNPQARVVESFLAIFGTFSDLAASRLASLPADIAQTDPTVAALSYIASLHDQIAAAYKNAASSREETDIARSEATAAEEKTESFHDEAYATESQAASGCEYFDATEDSVEVECNADYVEAESDGKESMKTMNSEQDIQSCSASDLPSFSESASDCSTISDRWELTAVDRLEAVAAIKEAALLRKKLYSAMNMRANIDRIPLEVSQGTALGFKSDHGKTSNGGVEAKKGTAFKTKMASTCKARKSNVNTVKKGATVSRDGEIDSEANLAAEASIREVIDHLKEVFEEVLAGFSNADDAAESAWASYETAKIETAKISKCTERPNSRPESVVARKMAEDVLTVAGIAKKEATDALKNAVRNKKDSEALLKKVQVLRKNADITYLKAKDAEPPALSILSTSDYVDLVCRRVETCIYFIESTVNSWYTNAMLMKYIAAYRYEAADAACSSAADMTFSELSATKLREVAEFARAEAIAHWKEGSKAFVEGNEAAKRAKVASGRADAYASPNSKKVSD